MLNIFFRCNNYLSSTNKRQITTPPVYNTTSVDFLVICHSYKLPPSLEELLFHSQADWISVSWPTLRLLYSRGLADSTTIRTYELGKHSYLHFWPSNRFEPFTFHRGYDMSVCCSLTQNLQSSSIHSYLSAVLHLQISAARVHSYRSLDLITYVCCYGLMGRQSPETSTYCSMLSMHCSKQVLMH